MTYFQYLGEIVGSNLSYLFLKMALKKPGCPICRLRDQSEARYLSNLLHENVNDATTRNHIIASLGYCPKHTWQMGMMEREKYSDALGNSIIYENLVKVVQSRITLYLEERKQGQKPGALKSFLSLLPFSEKIGNSSKSNSLEASVKAKCRVCQLGEQTEQSNLFWLLEDLSNSTPEFCELYLLSDGLCFHHLRQVLLFKDPRIESGIFFVAEDALGRLSDLGGNLGNYHRKHAWDRRFEVKTDAEQLSWLNALRFFGGNEDEAAQLETQKYIQLYLKKE